MQPMSKPRIQLDADGNLHIRKTEHDGGRMLTQAQVVTERSLQKQQGRAFNQAERARLLGIGKNAYADMIKRRTYKEIE